jgi:predicted ATPase/DNA-binding SARP family transcriptional activator
VTPGRRHAPAVAETGVLVLGPVRLRVGGDETVPGGPRERGVLAALALAGEGGIGHDRLVDLVWGHDAPRTAHRTAQAYLSRLRRVLGADAVLSTAGRHRLADVEVDLWEFERLVTSARRTPASAPGDLAAALAMWRDRSVAQDAALDGAADLLQAWERSRLDAQELALAHLDDDAVIRAAEALLDEAPHRERAWSALATAYYRTGQQEEALATIRTARRRLADDLGIDLSPGLEQLERDLLHHRVTPSPPRAVSEPVTRLVGRELAVDEVVAAVGRSRLVTLVGTGGIGKTRLALAAADRITEPASTPVFVARLAPATSTVAVRDALVEALDAGVPDLEEAARRRFERVPGLLVVDNCEHVLPTAADLVSSLLALPLRLRVLATSRAALGVAGELLVDVPPLEVGPAAGDAGPAPALRLFLDRAEEVADTAAWGERQLGVAEQICRALDGIPLALELAARRLRTVEITELRDDLGTVTSEPVRGGDPRHRSLATALEWSYRDLPEDQRAAFRRLGLLHGRLPIAAAADVVGGRAAVEGLLGASLLTRTTDGVGMYEPVRQYAVSLLEPAERAEGLTRVAEAVAAFTHRAASHLTGPDEIEWLGRMDALHGDVRAVLDWALANGRGDLIEQVVADLGYLWLLGWSATEGRRWLDAALGLSVDPHRRASLLAWSSALASRMGDAELARSQGREAVALARPHGDTLLLARALHALALPDKYAGETHEARALLQEAHALRLQGGDLGGAAMSLGAIADIDVNEGDFERAAEGYAVGLPLMRSAGTARGLVAYLHSMAELELMRGEPARADELATEAWPAALETRDVWHVAQLQSVRAVAARDLGLPEEQQRQRDRAALEAASAQADPQILLDVVEHVAGRLTHQGRYADALRLFRASADLRRRAGILVSVPRRARRDADEAEARRHATPPRLEVVVDLAWLAAAAMDAVG